MIEKSYSSGLMQCICKTNMIKSSSGAMCCLRFSAATMSSGSTIPLCIAHKNIRIIIFIKNKNPANTFISLNMYTYSFHCISHNYIISISENTLYSPAGRAMQATHTHIYIAQFAPCMRSIGMQCKRWPRKPNCFVSTILLVHHARPIQFSMHRCLCYYLLTRKEKFYMHRTNTQFISFVFGYSFCLSSEIFSLLLSELDSHTHTHTHSQIYNEQTMQFTPGG